MSSFTDIAGGIKVSQSSSHSISVIIPTFNGARRIGKCLHALTSQTSLHSIEILVVDDGSTDDTAAVVANHTGVRLISQRNAGPAAARNRGALEAQGNILLFTDDDCVPTSNWLNAMLTPFEDEEVVGAKGVYLTHQKALAARFVQLEYEDKYRLMSTQDDIDFIDTYSAGYRRERFLEMKGYDTSFPVACAEDVELSYRMSALGWKMRFVPEAIVYHTHPDSFSNYLKKKYKFAYWRILAVRKNPSKGIKDSHTPQLMKLQLLLVPFLTIAAVIDITIHPPIPSLLLTGAAFLVSTIPFVVRSFRRDRVVALLSPAILAARACAQLAGVTSGLIHARRITAERVTDVPA